MKNVKRHKQNRLTANGWDCFIKPTGAISCITTQEYNGVKYKLMFKIFKNGEIVWLRQKADEEADVLRRLKLEKWPVDGIIKLPTGFDNKENTILRKEAVRLLLQESYFQEESI